METTQATTASNKAFLKEIVSSRLPLMDYPERICEDIVLHEPSALPFGGRYVGMQAYKDLVPSVMAYYDYERFELLGIFADEKMVFVTLNVGIKGSEKIISLCEQFIFKEEKIAEIRIFILN